MTSRTNITHRLTGGPTGQRAVHSEEIQGQELGCDIITAHRGYPGQSGTEGPGAVSVGNFSGGLCSVRSSVCCVESERGSLQPYSPHPWSHQTGMTTSYFRSLTVPRPLGNRAHAIRSTVRQKKALLLRSSKAFCPRRGGS